MKKSVWTIIVLVMGLCLVACGKKANPETDESAKQVSNNANNDIGRDPGEDDVSEIAKKLQVPDSCEITFDTGETKLSSIMLKDEKIDVPKTEDVYMISYDKVDAPCSEEELKTIISRLFDESQGISGRDGVGLQTKYELDNLIKQYEASREEALAKGNTQEAEALGEEIDNYKAQREVAPDELPMATQYKINEEYIGKKDGIERTFKAASDAENVGMDNYYFVYEMTLKGQADALASEVPGSNSTYEVNVVGENTYNDDESNPMDQKEGLDMATKLLDELGINGFVCKNTEETVRAWTGGSCGDKVYKKPDGYRYYFSRQIDGVDVVLSQETGMVDNIDTENLTYKGGREMASISVNKAGIVSANVYVYTDEKSFKKETVTLLNWDKMLEAAEQNIAKYYEKYPTQADKVTFDDVKLAYVPWADEDGKKYLIPAWIFSQNEYNSNYRSDVPVQLVYINAIDGSYIDILDNMKNLEMYEGVETK